MQSLSLLRLIEKFAEIHRQVPLCSLTTICLRAFVSFFGLNPFQLQNAPHSALKLHFLFLNKMGVTLGCRPNLLGASIRETRIGALSSTCGRRARFANAQALLAISDFRHAEPRTAGAWLQSSNPSREHRSLHPLSAARGSQAGNQKIAYSFFSYCFSIASICALAAFCAS